MPIMLFYLPMIIWAGMFDLAHQEMRAPVNIPARIMRPRAPTR